MTLRSNKALRNPGIYLLRGNKLVLLKRGFALKYLLIHTGLEPGVGRKNNQPLKRFLNNVCFHPGLKPGVNENQSFGQSLKALGRVVVSLQRAKLDFPGTS